LLIDIDSTAMMTGVGGTKLVSWKQAPGKKKQIKEN
jgi:hypothetical protein